jgi:organic hydroperoxide reductase OsmC/OhrA
MPARTHTYQLQMTWTGNLGPGTTTPRAYSRDAEIGVADKGVILGSSDPAFRGDPTRWNPEELLVASLAQCHMLWYLDLATRAGIVVTAYSDAPTGTMAEEAAGAGQFTSVTLRPTVTVTPDSPQDEALRLHDDIGAWCFIARSVSFPLHHEPVVQVAAV